MLTLAIDQGTTGTTVLLVTVGGEIVGRAYREHPQYFPQAGFVEHDANAIWQSVLDAAAELLADKKVSDIAAIGITNQRETVVAWDRDSRRAYQPTIVWQDRRTAARCEELETAGYLPKFRKTTGLPLDPYFSATKIEWLLTNNSDVRRASERGALRVGTVDAWLIDRLTSGASFVTDASNASRTQLFDIHAGEWSSELCALFQIDPEWLPKVVASSGAVGVSDPAAFLGIEAPIAGIAGDQQAALFGQACVEEGQAKATFGTGAFVLVNSGVKAPTTSTLLSTVAWRINEELTYALEGSIFTAGASVQWLRDNAKFVQSSPDIEELAASVDDTDGALFVPAFTGLGAPYWRPDARAALLGMSRGTTQAHIARALLESVAFRVRQVVDAMRAEGTHVTELRVDGGMAANNLFLQLQADILGVPVIRPVQLETTSLGAAQLAALGAGLHQNLEAVADAWQQDRVFEPKKNERLAHNFSRFDAACALVSQLR